MREKLRSVKVKRKLDIYRNYMMVIIVLMGIVSAALAMMMNSQIKEITEVWSPSLAKAQELDTITSDYRLRQYGHLVATSPEELARYDKMLAETEQEMDVLIKEFQDMVALPEEQALLDIVQKEWEEYHTVSQEVIKASRANDTKKGGELMMGAAYDSFQEFNAAFDQLEELENREIAAAKQSVTITFYVILAVVVLAIAIGILVAKRVSTILTEVITEPVKQIKDAAVSLREGDMSAAKLLTYESEDEYGEVAEALRDAMKTLDGYVAEISATLREMAKGDLTKNGEEITDFRGDFADIKESFIYILKKFNSTLTEIQNTSNQVAVGADGIEGAAGSLSEGATDQASAIEELTATVETVAKMADDSAKNTEEAYENIKQSVVRAERESERMEELIAEMKRITEISKEIANIITAIEDIASQTNLLSLNASIEAARAGEAGRGFAVVADQIGTLASDSAQSAVNTRELIEKTLEEIEKGNAITAKTSEAFEAIIGDMQAFAEVAHQTTETAQNQATALEQIESGIDQISGAMQNTASASEESAAISGELSGEAGKLNELVQRFKLF